MSGVLETERTTVNISDDKARIATVDTLTVDQGSLTVNPVAVIRYQLDNHLGSASLELDEKADIISYEEYHPFGTTSYRSGRTETETSQKRYKYVGKERDEETGLYYYGFRYYAAWLCRFVSVDPMETERQWLTPYNYVQNNPINKIDPTGALDEDPPQEKKEEKKQGAYKPTEDKNGKVTGFEWDDENAYDDKGKLNEGYYEKAILFKDNPKKVYELDKKWDSKKGRYYGSNMNSAKAVVYYKDKDGNKASKTFDACTRPSDPNYFATVKEGFFNAKFGTHKGYDALKTFSLSGKSWEIPTDGVNPSSEKGESFAIGIDIHKAGFNNMTSSIWSTVKLNGKKRIDTDARSYPMFDELGNITGALTKETEWNPKKYSGISEGCFLIDRDRWDEFIELFDKNDTNIGIALTRDNKYSSPAKKDIPKLKKFNIKTVFKIQTF